MCKEEIIFEPSLKPVDKILYQALIIKSKENVVSGITIQELTQDLGVSERTVMRSFKFLEQQGFIEIIKRRNSQGQQLPNTYKILK